MTISNKYSSKIWITWERQRRSIELAKAFNADLYIFAHKGILRYVKCMYKTFSIVKKKRPDVLFVQNPSMILAFFSTCFLKPIFSLVVVIDRHSNFLLTPKKRSLFEEYFFNFLSFITIRHADLTIVTNEFLAHVVRVLGGRPFALPDKLPTLLKVGRKKLTGDKKLLVISSFAEDEPVKEIWQAFGKKEMSSYSVYMSGNFTKAIGLNYAVPQNVILTGFLPEDEFIDTLFEVDAVMVLTKMKYTLLCGCYEAIAAEKPLVTSNTTVLNQLFFGAMCVENEPDSIAEGIQKLFFDLPKYKSKSLNMKKVLIENWNHRFKKLESTLKDIMEKKRHHK